MKAICQICMHHCSLILSVGSYGCNLRCLFCQNHEISMTDASASEAVYVSPEELLPFIDAMNIDLKGFDEAYYRKLSGDPQSVKDFIVRAHQECHVELTTLIAPFENDVAFEKCVCGELLRENGFWLFLRMKNSSPERAHIVEMFKAEINKSSVEE